MACPSTLLLALSLALPTGQAQRLLLTPTPGSDGDQARLLRTQLRELGAQPRFVLPDGAVVVDVEPGRPSELLAELELVAEVSAPGQQPLYVSASDLALWSLLEQSQPSSAWPAPPATPSEQDEHHASASGPEAESGASHSAALLGDVAVGLLLPESDGRAEPSQYDWSPEQQRRVLGRVLDALDGFFSAWPRVPLSFLLVLESAPPPGGLPGTVACAHEPAAHPNMDPASDLSSLRSLGVEAASVSEARALYLERLRQRSGAQQAVLLKLVNDGDAGAGRASALLGGPQATCFLSSSPATIRHELAHLFGALDEYCSSSCGSPSAAAGVLALPNANALGSDGSGPIGGAGEGAACLMLNLAGELCPHTRGALGWWDPDGDGLPELLATPPAAELLELDGSPKPPLLRGQAWLRSPLFDRQLLLGHVADVELSIDGGPWLGAEAADGRFDSSREAFVLPLPPLPPGPHRVEARARSSWGVVGPSSQALWIDADAWAVDEAPPVAVLELPRLAGLGSRPLLSARASRDPEGSSLSARFDLGCDGVWESPWLGDLEFEPVLEHSGRVPVCCEVRDAAGMVTRVERELLVAREPLPAGRLSTPAGVLHGQDSVRLEAVHAPGVTSGWDLGADGQVDLEDTPVVDLGLDGERSEVLPLALELRAARGGLRRHQRSLISIPWNTAPSASLELRSVSAQEVVLDASGSHDPDASRDWESELLYRWDLDGDGHWDTDFAPESQRSLTLTPGGPRRVGVELRDRYRALARASLELDPESPPEWVSEPGLGSAVAGPCGVELVWGQALSSRQPLRYRVYRWLQGETGATEARLLTETAELSWLDRDALPERNYRYLVRAVDADGLEDANSRVLAVQTPSAGGQPTAPSDLRVAKRGSVVDLSWQPVPDGQPLRLLQSSTEAGPDRSRLLAPGSARLSLGAVASGLLSWRLEALPAECQR